MTDALLVLTTVPVGDEGQRIAETLIEERLAACVNLLSPMTSLYRWNGAIERSDERQLIIKTSRARLTALKTRLEALHSYDVPELLVISVADGSEAYLKWVSAETTSLEA